MMAHGFHLVHFEKQVWQEFQVEGGTLEAQNLVVIFLI